MCGLELSGNLHVKVPTRDRKFNSWKVREIDFVLEIFLNYRLRQSNF